MDLQLDGKAACVMASSQGLGRAAATVLSREGARVVICARTEKRLEQTAREIHEETGNEVVPIQADVSEPQDVEGLIDGTVDAFGGLDVLVTNKGGPAPGGFEEVSDQAWTDGFGLVVLSYVRAVRAALPHLRQGGGSVVAIESTSVKEPIEDLVLSNALRPSVVAASKSLSRRYAGDGVRFNVVLPGSMATDRIDDLIQARADDQGIPFEQAREDWLSAIPAGRIGEPIELGELIAFLASPRAGYITGGVFQADGGRTSNVY